MKKMAVTVLCFLALAVLWLSCFQSEARQFVGHAGGDFTWKPAAASAESVGPGTPRSDSISPTITASDVTTRAASTHPDVNGPHVPVQSSGRFDHLVADTSSEEAMAPQKSDTADALAASTR
jgi:hypothetical protein